MAQPQQLAYFGIDRPTLPYRSFTSPVDESPHFASGSANVLALASGYLTKRPGWSAALEPALSAVPDRIVRIFAWKRWAGSSTNPDAFIVMLGTLNGTVARVWKLNLAIDTSFTLLWTETTPAGTSVPFDFIEGGNFCFFGNASTRADMRKYDASQCTLWGLDAPPAPPTFAIIDGTLPPGLEFDQASGILSGTPTRAGSSLIQVAVTDQTGGTSPVTYSLYSGTLPSGVTLSSTGVLYGTPAASTASQSFGFAVQVMDSATPMPTVLVQSFALFVGDSGITFGPADPLPSATVSQPYSQAVTPGGGTGPYSIGFVSGSAPPGLKFTTTTTTSAPDANGATTTTTTYALAGTPTRAGTFLATIRVSDASTPTPRAAEFTYTILVTATTLTITTISLPVAQVGQPYSSGGSQVRASGGTPAYSWSATSGSLTAQTGYIAGYTYTSIYGHESAMSPLSASTGLFTDQDIAWDVIASSDPQVTGINFYRTPDGGAATPGTMRLVATLANATSSFRDSVVDTSLGSLTGPAEFINAPPQSLRGFVTSNGRIWGFNASAVWFTGDEEVTNGSPLESMSNAQNGNYYRWPSETFALAVTDSGVDSLLSEEVWQVAGDTLDTFRKSRILRGGGTLSPTCATVVGSTVYWIDTARQVWSSDKGEIGEPIRTDLATLDLAKTYLAFHKSGRRNWLAILDAVASVVYVYDFDLAQWQTPWTLANPATALASIQTGPSTIALAIAFASGHVRVLTDAAYDDDGTPYADQLRSGLLAIVPGRGTTARNSESVRQIDQWEMETDTTDDADGNPQPNRPTQFYSLVDDDPTQTLDAWTELTSAQPLHNGRTDALALAATRWPESTPPAGRRVAFAAVWAASTSPWSVYSFDLAIKPRMQG